MSPVREHKLDVFRSKDLRRPIAGLPWRDVIGDPGNNKGVLIHLAHIDLVARKFDLAVL